jgi:N-acetylglucosamine kinase-like BadF-type ATPase
VLVVDGGNSKTDVALIDAAGAVLGSARTGGSSHKDFGVDGSMDVLDRAISDVAAAAGLDPRRRPVARLGIHCLAGADLPVDDRRLGRAIRGRGWTEAVEVRNDTFAVLRAGTDRGWGVAVVCGAGLNCAGVGPDGREVRFPALGDLSGDRAAGGEWLGRAALGAALRARDGRGPRTALERDVPARLGVTTPIAALTAIHVGRFEEDVVLELAPVVFRSATAGDAVSRGLLGELADEIVVLVVAASRRLRLGRQEFDVVLGGGVFRNRNREFEERIVGGVAAAAPGATVRWLQHPPVVGAGLIGLDRVGAPARAKARARAELAATFEGHRDRLRRRLPTRDGG